MKKIMSALLALGLVATPVAINAKEWKANHGETQRRDRAARNTVVGPGVSFDGRSSLGGSKSFNSRKPHRAPDASGGGETFDGGKFFDDGMLNGG